MNKNMNFEESFMYYLDEYSDYLDSLDLEYISFIKASLIFFKNGVEVTDRFLFELGQIQLLGKTYFSDFFMNAPDSLKRDIIQNIVLGSYAPIAPENMKSQFKAAVFDFVGQQYSSKKNITSDDAIAGWSGFIGNLNDELSSFEVNINDLSLIKLIKIDFQLYINTNYEFVLSSYVDADMRSIIPSLTTFTDKQTHDLSMMLDIHKNVLINKTLYTPFSLKIISKGYSSYARSFNKYKHNWK